MRLRAARRSAQVDGRAVETGDLRAIGVDIVQAVDVDTAFAAARAIAANQIIRVAFPKYVRRPYVIRTMDVSNSAGGPAVAGELVANIGAVAEKSLEDRLALVRTKTKK